MNVKKPLILDKKLIEDYITIVRIYVLRQIDNISGYCADLAYIFWQTDNISGYCADFSANIFGYCADFSAYIFEYCADFSAYIFEYMPISLIKILNKDRLKNIFFFEYQTKYGVFFIHKCTKFYLRATI